MEKEYLFEIVSPPPPLKLGRLYLPSKEKEERLRER
jgi:hypothetical protein